MRKELTDEQIVKHYEQMLTAKGCPNPQWLEEIAKKLEELKKKIAENE